MLVSSVAFNRVYGKEAKKMTVPMHWKVPFRKKGFSSVLLSKG